jgi:hypothetical protein
MPDALDRKYPNAPCLQPSFFHLNPHRPDEIIRPPGTQTADPDSDPDFDMECLN